MSTLRSLHEALFVEAHATFPSQKPAIVAKPALKPIIPMSRWQKFGQSDKSEIHKTYVFMNVSDRNAFIRELMDYEASTSHTANIEMFGTNVTIVLTTLNIGVSDLDKEYARFADDVFTDVAFLTMI